MWSPVEYTGGGAGGGSSSAPCARAKHSATLLGGHIYVLGGRGAGGALPLRDFWRYTLASGSWERLQARGEAPPALQEHSATAHGAHLYVFGGEATALSAETPLWIYDTETQFWRKLSGQSSYSSSAGRRSEARGAGGVRGARGGAGPSGRRGHSAHALKDCLLIYGGYKDLRGSTNELWAFHYESSSWQAVRTCGAGPARHRHGAALHGARLYVHGGQCDLRACSDLWHYDTISRVWSAVRASGRLSPGALCGHAAARAGAHLYVFGGDAGAAPHANNHMWRFHFATETWERIAPSPRWPAARVDGRALLVPGAPRARSGGAGAPAGGDAAARPAAPTLLARLSSFQVRRAPRCAYSALGSRDSAESLSRESPPINRSRSAHLLAPRQPADGADADLTRERVSVPDFADVAPPTPVPAKLVYLDSEEEEDGGGATLALRKSASVRFARDAATTDEEGEFSTSDYASAERVNRLSGVSLGFSNPHYLGPDVRALGAALTPDSGLGPGDIELRDMSAKRTRVAPRDRDERLHLLLVGGREPPHVARLQGPLSMWTYRLL